MPLIAKNKVFFMKFSYTGPLGLEGTLEKESFKGHTVAWLGVFLAAMGIFSLRGEWLLLPGVSVDLPALSAGAQEGAQIAGVLTISSCETLFFDGRVLPLSQLAVALKTHLSVSRHLEPALLLKADRQTSVEFLLQVGQAARDAGFERIHLACQIQEKEPQLVEF
jgi:biopolymer transport protein ExbD